MYHNYLKSHRRPFGENWKWPKVGWSKQVHYTLWTDHPNVGALFIQSTKLLPNIDWGGQEDHGEHGQLQSAQVAGQESLYNCISAISCKMQYVPETYQV